MIDLTHDIYDQSPQWPGDQAVSVKRVSTGTYQQHSITLTEHSGTHIGAPSHYHFAQTMSDFALDYMQGQALLLDCTGFSEESIGAEELKGLLARQQTNVGPHYPLVVVLTAWAAYWESDAYFTGLAPAGPNTPKQALLPAGLNLSGAKYLLARFSPHIIGIDSPNIDFGGAALNNLECGIELARHKVFHLENIAAAPPGLPLVMDYLLMPLRIDKGTGSPARLLLQAS